MTDQLYKDFIECEILKGIIFNEDSYNVDAGQHFELAPNDIVTLDIAPYGKKIIADMKAFRSAKYGQVEVDPDTKEVTINGQPLQTDAPNGQGNASAAPGAPGQNDKPINPDSKKSLVDFLRMLKANGSLEKIAQLDPATKKKMATKILGALNKQPEQKPEAQPAQQPEKKPEAAGEVPLPPMPAAKPEAPKTPKSNDPSLNEELLLKEALIIIYEADSSNVAGPSGEPDRAKAKAAAANVAAGKKVEVK